VAAIEFPPPEPMLSKNTKVDIKNYSLALFIAGTEAE
jgi:hypothetical protein